jgi:hypothetical protein
VEWTEKPRGKSLLKGLEASRRSRFMALFAKAMVGVRIPSSAPSRAAAWPSGAAHSRLEEIYGATGIRAEVLGSSGLNGRSRHRHYRTLAGVD